PTDFIVYENIDLTCFKLIVSLSTTDKAILSANGFFGNPDCPLNRPKSNSSLAYRNYNQLDL
ncbi:unnamed protein product, partial [Rotaria socialis]